MLPTTTIEAMMPVQAVGDTSTYRINLTVPFGSFLQSTCELCRPFCGSPYRETRGQQGMFKLIVAICFATAELIAWVLIPAPLPQQTDPVAAPSIVHAAPYHLLYAYVTGFNTVSKQTDTTPCIAATGDNICGRRNVVACPRSLPFGTVVEINGKAYLCEDRTAQKFNGRFDISCDKDRRCPFRVAGWMTVKVFED